MKTYVGLDDGPKFFSDMTLFLLRDFSQREVSQHGNHCVTAELTVLMMQSEDQSPGFSGIKNMRY